MTCKKEDCADTVYGRGMCQRHYTQWYRQQPRVKKRMKKWSGTKSIKFMHKARFGGLRDKVLKRDGYRCVECGMTRKQHKEKWGRDITVDHINGEGRNSQNPEHDERNLQTMCLKCHGRKDYYLTKNPR